MNSAFFLVLRRMRAPIIVLIVIYGISVVGLTLVPGVTPEGQPAPPMSFFHAFYFISYTATTIGFGEIPYAFSDAQRMWVTLCIYLTVVGWSYSVVTLIALLQDKGFQNTLTVNRFRRRVRMLKAPFYLVCGAGETGALIARTFDRINQAFVVIEKDELRTQEIDLLDFQTDTPALAGDASIPENLLAAGLQHPKCRGVLAITNDETSNLAIAIAVRLLNPKIPVIARADSQAVHDNMASFGTTYIINPFERFAEHLALAVASPERFRLIELLTSLPETPLPQPHRPPPGHWILCGYGHFGQAVAEHLRPTGITLTIIDPTEPGSDISLAGYGTEAETLHLAGIERASGIVAGSDSDVNNLSIAMTASALKPELFVVARQNHSANSALFAASRPDFTMVATQIVAQEAVAILTTPLLAQFLDAMRTQDEVWAQALSQRLLTPGSELTPIVWDICLNISQAPAAYHALMHRRPFTLGAILRDRLDREEGLHAVILMVSRAETPILLPEADFELAAGDRLLVASTLRARRDLELTLQNANELAFVLSGNEKSGSWLWLWLRSKLMRRRKAALPG